MILVQQRYAPTALATAIITTTLPVYASDSAQPIEEVIISGSVLGSSLPEEVQFYPGNRNIISAEMLEKNAVLSIDGALQSVSGIKVQDETGTGVLPNVAVRGLNASRSGYTQFLLDGVPLTLAPYGHTGQSLFPMTLKSLDRIDIVRGGAAVQYGPNNVGGVINLVTKAIPEQWRTSLSEKLTSFSGGNLLSDSYVQTGGKLSDNFALQLEGNLIKGESFREHSDTEVQNWLLKTEWAIDEQQTLATTLQYYDADTEMPGALTTAAYKQDRSQSLRLEDEFQGNTKRITTRYNYQFKNLAGADAGEFDWMAFGHDSSRNFDWGFSTHPDATHWADSSAPVTHLRSSPREFSVWGTEPRVSLQFSGEQVSHKVTIGSRFVEEDIDYKLEQTDISTGIKTTPRDWRLQTSAIAAYVSDEISLLNDQLSITPGVRFEQVDMEFTDLGLNTEADNKITETLPGLTVGYASDEAWFFYGNAQRSLRVPQIAVIRGSGNEGAELAWNYELGTRYNWSENASVSASLYRIDFKDQLLYNSTNQSFENVGATQHQGVELEVFYAVAALPALKLHMAYSYLDSEQLEGVDKGKELPYASKHQLSWDASYQWQDIDMMLSGYYYSSSYSDNANTKVENVSGTVGELPAYTVWNLQISKTFALANEHSLFTALSVNNVFDKEYYFRGIDVSPAGRYPATERSISLEAKYSF
ncbi:TonB-dependent siderophore receptor [Dasania sp. GY-MA-18]|uniref:TonB-dependent siderophore receptor n=1 Tax=Dasania phycosphaerae TaxID=2950436 RepID=A0A9J6RIT1_9GAMM|nr:MULTISPECIES: TonB-dependent siderophore receptor [Dasania]MCR8922170.1 TonB-dependent siderophore receptor [Dasania sp. GY-MA-18]MCZ0864598.1 TonB-dependent siderophore receptor [Dasania phycosphaerae]MCZ0868326.1 TonB-dependent siderophore receptor [Dasania phycosphaerae]